MSQPFYYATLEDGTKFLLNENQVSTIKPGNKINDDRDRQAIITMSNGEVLVVIDPSYSNWEADFYTRKF